MLLENLKLCRYLIFVAPIMLLLDSAGLTHLKDEETNPAKVEFVASAYVQDCIDAHTESN